MKAIFEPQGVIRCEGCKQYMMSVLDRYMAPLHPIFTCYTKDCPNVGKHFELPTIELKEVECPKPTQP